MPDVGFDTSFNSCAIFNFCFLVSEVPVALYPNCSAFSILAFSNLSLSLPLSSPPKPSSVTFSGSYSKSGSSGILLPLTVTALGLTAITVSLTLLAPYLAINLFNSSFFTLFGNPLCLVEAYFLVSFFFIPLAASFTSLDTSEPLSSPFL